MCIPSMGLNGDDQQLWRFTKDGCYSVKLGFRRCCDIAYGSTHPKGRQWHKLWQLNLPSRIRYFLWRLGKVCWPLRSYLQYRGISVPLCCIHFEKDVENACHIFLTCPLEKSCWQKVGLMGMIEGSLEYVEGFIDCLFSRLQAWPPYVMNKAAMVLWGLW